MLSKKATKIKPRIRHLLHRQTRERILLHMLFGLSSPSTGLKQNKTEKSTNSTKAAMYLLKNQSAVSSENQSFVFGS